MPNTSCYVGVQGNSPNLKLIDTHTHFDMPEFGANRDFFIQRAWEVGIRHLVLTGYQVRYFGRMHACASYLAGATNAPTPHLAFGLHPLYINEHQEADLAILDNHLHKHHAIAIGEVGLDTYYPHLKETAIFGRQLHFFESQIALAKAHNLPLLLHIRKSHADALAALKHHNFKNGGIAHSFSGGVQEAFGFIKMSFKIGITGQITNPNAKKLHRTVRAVIERFGVSALVIETDCPDMTPLPYHHLPFNEPATLPATLNALAQISQMPADKLAKILWQNSNEAFGMVFDEAD